MLMQTESTMHCELGRTIENASALAGYVYIYVMLLQTTTATRAVRTINVQQFMSIVKSAPSKIEHAYCAYERLSNGQK